MIVLSKWKERTALVVLLTIGISSTGCRESKEEELVSQDLESLVDQLEVVTVESDMWLLLFKSVLGGSGYQFDLQYKPFEGRVQTNRIPAHQAVSIGDTFFKEDPGKDRFKLKQIEIRKEDGSVGQRPLNWAIIEDLSESKKGKTYECPFNLSAAQRNSFIQYDHTIVFQRSDIEGLKKQFRVQENASFSIPHGEKETPFKLIEVKLEDPGPATRKAVAVLVQYEINGEIKTREIPVPQTK